jgi:hypothetical protein
MTNGQGKQVGRTLALPEDMDRDLAKAADDKRKSVSELMRKWIPIIIKTESQPNSQNS